MPKFSNHLKILVTVTACVFAALTTSANTSAYITDPSKIWSDRPEWQSCVNKLVGAPTTSIGAVVIACDSCTKQNASINYGASWIGTRNSAVTTANEDDVRNGYVTTYLWGTAYSCARNWGKGAQIMAYNLWIGDGAGANGVHSPVADYIEGVPSQMRRGIQGDARTWAKPLGKQKIRINIKKFEEGANCTSNAKGTKKTCKRTVSINRCFNKLPSYAGNSINSCGGQDSTITLKISIPQEEEKKVPKEGDFSAKTTIHIPAQNGDVLDYTKESGVNGDATVAFSTKSKSVTVEFWHNIYYDAKLYTPQSSKRPGRDVDNTYDNICAKLTAVKQTRKYRPSTGAWDTEDLSTKEDFCTGGNGNKNDYKYQPEGSKRTVSLKPGETKIVCQRLKLRDSKWKVTETTTYDWTDPASWVWVPSYSCGCDTEGNNCSTCGGYGYYSRTNEERKTWDATLEDHDGPNTSACAMITRPAEPDPNPDPDPDPDPDDPDDPDEADMDAVIDGNNGTDTLYVGENAGANWTIHAPYYPTHRVEEYQDVLYHVPGGQLYDAGIVSGANNLKVGPCSVGSRSAWGCASKHGQGGLATKLGATWEPFDEDKESPSLIVPDYLGDKYCASGGVHYQYWRGVADSRKYNDLGSFTWELLPNLDYWNIMRSSCKTLSKKPAISIWNGSLYTGANIDTFTSNRFTNASEWFKDFSSSDERKLYGSWSEHIAAVGGTTKNFASGSSLAVGSQFNANGNFWQNSTLTIANQGAESGGELGKSGIKVSTAIDQLKARMLNNNNAPSEETNSIGNVSGVTDTRVYHATGDLEITGNIENNGSGYGSISAIPQILIFADQNVNIHSNVKRIDAWLIVDGTINTCTEFKNGKDGTDKGTDANGTIGGCNQQLIFNGPVVAKDIKLNRSYGSEANSGVAGSFNNAPNSRTQPGEVFNYRADAYLWAYAQSGKFGTSLNEVYMSELAPRY